MSCEHELERIAELLEEKRRLQEQLRLASIDAFNFRDLNANMLAALKVAKPYYMNNADKAIVIAAIAKAEGRGSERIDELESLNARLLAALKLVRSELLQGEYRSSVLRQIDAAIAKEEGRG